MYQSNQSFNIPLGIPRGIFSRHWEIVNTKEKYSVNSRPQLYKQLFNKTTLVSNLHKPNVKWTKIPI